MFGDFNQKIEGERNAVWLMFMDDYYKNLFTDWEKHAEDLVARFRSVYSHYTMDNWILDFIKKMCKMSKKFDYWWSVSFLFSIFLYDDTAHAIPADLTGHGPANLADVSYDI